MNFKSLALFTLALLLAAPAFAQGKVGVVDMEAVTQKSQKIQANVSQAQASVRPQQDQIESKMSEWGRLRSDLSARRSVMKDSDIDAQEARVRALREQIDELKFDVDKKIKRLQDEVMRPEIERIMKAVEQIAKQEGYAMIIPADAVLYMDSAVDITPLVIQAVDRSAGAAVPAAEPKSALPQTEPAKKAPAESPRESEPKKSSSKKRSAE